MSWWVCLLCAAVSIGLGYIMVLFPRVFSGFTWMFVGETALLIPMAVCLLLAKKLTPYYEIKDIVGFNRFDVRILLIVFFLPMAVQGYASLTTLPVSGLLNRLFGGNTQTMLQMQPQNLIELLLLFLSICVVAPIVEEIIFRGGILHMLDRYGNVFAVLVSAVAFSVIHFNPAGFFVTFALGIVLGFVRYTSDSIYPCIIMHAANNLLGFLQIIFISDMGYVSYIFAAVSWIFMLACAVAAPVLLIAYCKILNVKANFTKAYAKPGISIGLILTMTLYIVSMGANIYRSDVIEEIQYDIKRFEQRLIPDSGRSRDYRDDYYSPYGYYDDDFYDFDLDDFFY